MATEHPEDLAPVNQNMVEPEINPISVYQDADTNPSHISTPIITTDAIWDLQLSFDFQAASGALGNVGAEFDHTYYYTTRLASNLIHRMDMSGNLVEEFSIPGVSGLRDPAFDGTYMYGGAAHCLRCFGGRILDWQLEHRYLPG